MRMLRTLLQSEGLNLATWSRWSQETPVGHMADIPSSALLNWELRAWAWAAAKLTARLEMEKMLVSELHTLTTLLFVPSHSQGHRDKVKLKQSLAKLAWRSCLWSPSELHSREPTLPLKSWELHPPTALHMSGMTLGYSKVQKALLTTCNGCQQAKSCMEKGTNPTQRFLWDLWGRRRCHHGH